jgi:hypothetical protein
MISVLKKIIARRYVPSQRFTKNENSQDSDTAYRSPKNTTTNNSATSDLNVLIPLAVFPLQLKAFLPLSLTFPADRLPEEW